MVLRRTNELPGHANRALGNGVRRDKLTELVMHLAFYGGWPVANSGVRILRKVFAMSAAAFVTRL